MKKSTSRARRFAPALSVLSSTVATLVHAQVVEVSPVVVTASRIAQPLSETLSSVSVLTRADIDRSQAMTLADVLQGEAGFEFGRNGGLGGTTSFFLRGQDSINAVVLIDGVRSQTDKIGAIQITDFPLQQIERIEILKGNASALYGSGAAGGVINIITRENQGTPKTYASVNAGSYGTHGIFAGYGGSIDDVKFDLNLGRKKSSGFSAMNATQKPTANPDSDGYQNDFASLKFEKKIASDTKLGARFHYSVQDVDYDSGYSWDMASDVHKFKKTNQSATAYLRQALSADWLSDLSLTRSEYKYDDTLNGSPWPSSGYTNSLFKGWQNVLAWNNTYQLKPQTKVVFGAELSDDMFDGSGSQSAYKLTRRSNGYFAGVTHQIDRLTVQANARHDQLHVQNDSSATNEHYQANTGLFGVGYQLTQSWKLTGTVSTGFSAPTADAVGSNPGIRPEHHQSQEVGAVYNVRDTSLRAVYFQTKAKDAIIYNNAYSYVNGDIDNKGVELTARANAGAYSIKSSVTFQEPRDVLQNLPQARRAKHYGSLEVSRMVSGYEVGSRLYASGARPDSNFTPGVVLPGYSIWSFYASRKLDKDWTARIKLENAFDKHYQLAYGYNTPGRGIYATLQYSPK